MDKKIINSKIIAVKNELINKNSKIENSLAYKCEIPERNKRTDRKQNKIRDKITIEPPLWMTRPHLLQHLNIYYSIQYDY